MNEYEAAQLLNAIDAPRQPRAAFARALHAELFEGETPLLRDESIELAEPDADPPRRRSRGSRFIAAAIAACLAGAIAWGAVVTHGRPNVTVATPEVKATVESACARFASTAFREVPRDQLLGPLNTSTMSDPNAPIYIRALEDALARFDEDLARADVRDEALERLVQTVTGALTRAKTFLAQGETSPAARYLRDARTVFDRIDQGLARWGIPACLS